MNIALIGYGKMGHAIERIAKERGHEIVLRISSSNKGDMTEANLQQANVAIEFTRPDAAKENVLSCLEAGVPVVCGTTGWNDEIAKAELKAAEKNTAFLQASNFSIGVNIFFEVNKLLASLMEEHTEYSVSIEETHHTQKKDAPSGTAITLAEQVLENIKRLKHWTKGTSNDTDTLPVISHRIEQVPGTHSIKYSSAIDDIEIIHTAHNRDGFALGAVLAAEFIAGKQGTFNMKDVLGIR
jgi:4-hydroxy-tetrahydrodipicolinate reductase